MLEHRNNRFLPKFFLWDLYYYYQCSWFMQSWSNIWGKNEYL